MENPRNKYPPALTESRLKVHPWLHLFRKGLFLNFICLAFQHAVADVKLAWDANTEPDVTGYFVYYGTVGGNYTEYLDAGNTTSASVPNLNPNSTYYFVVTAYNAEGAVSSPSNEVSAVSAPSGQVGTATFASATSISIPSSGVANPYPSALSVSGMAGTISNVTVTLKNISHTNPDDLDIILVSPSGKKVLLLSDAGGSGDLNNVTLTFGDAAAALLSNSGQLASGTYKPTNYNTNTDTFPSPAPGAPYGATLATFNGLDANGVWSLYVRDDASSNSGNIAGGWSLTVTTTGAQALAAEEMLIDTTAPLLPAVAMGTRDTSGGTTLQIKGTPGDEYSVEASEDLVSWQAIGTLSTDDTGAGTFIDENAAAFAKRYYRLKNNESQ
jgi:subtilisin-like proprotein convertase family protein